VSQTVICFAFNYQLRVRQKQHSQATRPFATAFLVNQFGQLQKITVLNLHLWR